MGYQPDEEGVAALSDAAREAIVEETFAFQEGAPVSGVTYPGITLQDVRSAPPAVR